MKNYNIELSPDNWEKLRVFLIENNIGFESSECFNLIHIEIKCSEHQAEEINKFLEV